MAGAVVEGLAVIPGTTEDEVWLSVKRTINASTYRAIERMSSFDWGDSQRDCFFVDGGTTWDGGAAITITGIAVAAITNRVTVTAGTHGFTDGWTVKIAGVVGMTDVNEKVYTVADKAANTFVLKTRDGTAYIDGSEFVAYTSGGTVERVAASVSGLTHLAGENVVVLRDGQADTGTVTAGGVYTIGVHDNDFNNTIHVGLDSTYTLAPMPGMSADPKVKITELKVWVYQSAGGKLGSSLTDAQDIDYELPGDVVGADVVLVDRTLTVDHQGGWQDEATVVVTGNGPLPMTVPMIRYRME
jgi:hypothetical protein